MTRPVPTQVMHFTHVQNLSSILEDGLLSDTLTRQSSALQVEIGHPEIKERRRKRTVPLGAGGVVADYVPFYFGPKSAMMLKIASGDVPGYLEGLDPVVYLVTTVEDLALEGCSWVATDRNAAKAVASFTQSMADLESWIDWPLMKAQWWNSTPEEPDRMERRMAECLAHGIVPWGAFTEVVVKTPATAAVVEQKTAAAGWSTPVSVRLDWYYS